MSSNEIFKAAVALPPQERMMLIERIRASLPDTDDLEMPVELARELDERVAAYRRDGDPGSNWETVKARITNRRA